MDTTPEKPTRNVVVVTLLPAAHGVIKRKARARALEIGLPFLSIANYMRWAALVAPVEMEPIESTPQEPTPDAQTARLCN